MSQDELLFVRKCSGLLKPGGSMAYFRGLSKAHVYRRPRLRPIAPRSPRRGRLRGRSVRTRRVRSCRRTSSGSDPGGDGPGSSDPDPSGSSRRSPLRLLSSSYRAPISAGAGR
jgi:hypothetical protein